MILSPSEYYARCKGQMRYMRDVNGPFEARLAKGERKRLRRCEKEGFFVSDATITATHRLISENRAAKGRKYGMSIDDWCWLINRGYAHIFGVFPGLIAAAFVVRVAPDTAYVSAWGDAPRQQTRSPVVLLASGIYNWCLLHEIAWMDIGTADEPGLIAFKQRLGFEARVL